MTESDVDALQKELDSFRAEQEKVRALVGQIGGAAARRRDRAINLTFITVIVALFVWDILSHTVLKQFAFFPSVVSLEIGILLVSVKIVWMIHKQARVEHFQFWILNSIEFRLNSVSQRLNEIAERQKDSRHGQTPSS